MSRILLMICAVSTTCLVAASVQFKVRSSVFDDVKIWYKGSAGNAVGTADSGTGSKIKNLPSLADTTSSMHGGSYFWWGWRMRYQNQKVDCPYAGCTIDSTPCMVVPPAVRNDDTSTAEPSGYVEVTINGETTTQPWWDTRRYGALYFDNWMSDWATDTVCSNWTAVLRFRSEIVNAAHGNYNNIFKIGSVWTAAAGAAAGVSLTLNPTNSLSDHVWPRIYVGKDYPDQEAYPIKGGRWVDCALVVDGQKLDTWLCWNCGTDETPTNRLVRFSKIYPTTAALPTIKGGSQAFLASSGVNVWGASYTNGIYNSDMAGKAFEGAFHQVAFWDRTLSDDEVREAMAGGTGRPNLVQVGMEGNGIEEFATSAQTASVSVTGAWENLNPILTAANPTATITFSCPAPWAGKPQYLRVPMAAASSAGGLSIALNGEALGGKIVNPGKVALFYVPESKIVPGVNTLVLTWTSGVSLVLDAVTMGGSWQFGESVSSFGYQSDVVDNPDRYVFNAACGSDAIHNRGTFSNGGNRETSFCFFVPADMVGKFRGVFTTRTQNTGWPTPSEMPYSFYVNNTAIGDFILKTAVETKVEIPDNVIAVGWNRAYWKTTSSGYWANIDWHKFEVLPPPLGMALFIR